MKFKIRDVQNRVGTMKIRKKLKSENDYVLLNIFVTMIYKKISFFDEKPFFDKFIFNLFDAHQKSSDT